MGTLYYGGMKYGQSNPPAGGAAGGKGGQSSGAEFQNLSPEEWQTRFGQMGMGGAGGRAGGGGNRGGNFVTGEIIAKDDKSITVKLRDARLRQLADGGQAGSKIIFLSDTTEISKFAAGAATDLEIGKTISASGKANSDGSITAQSIQLRPNLPNNPAPNNPTS